MRPSLLGLVVLCGIGSLSASGPASYWGDLSIVPGGPAKPANDEIVQMAQGVCSAQAPEYYVGQAKFVDTTMLRAMFEVPVQQQQRGKEKLAIVGPHQIPTPAECDSPNGFARQMFATQAIAVNPSQEKVKEENPSNLSALGEDAGVSQVSPNASSSCSGTFWVHPWLSFFSDSSSSEAEDDFSLPVDTCKHPNAMRKWHKKCAFSVQRRQKVTSKFQPHALFDLLQSSSGKTFLAPYFKGERISPLEAYITASWLRKHREYYFDKKMDGCLYCSPSTVLNGRCKCPKMGEDFHRVTRLKEKIASAVVASQQFVQRLKKVKPLSDESRRCAWVPALDGGASVPSAVRKIARSAKKNLQVGSKLVPFVTGYEADDEIGDELAIMGGLSWNASEELY